MRVLSIIITFELENALQNNKKIINNNDYDYD